MKSLSTFFARRFLFSPKSHSVINIISAVSMVALGIPVAAMVILTSVFNGFDGLIRRMYNEFDPDILITPAVGKVFSPDSLPADRIASLGGVSAVSFVLEDSGLVEYRGRQTTAAIKGVDDNFGDVVPIRSMLVRSRETEPPGAIVGQGVAYDLGMGHLLTDRLKVYVPRRGSYSALLPMSGFSAGELPVEGIFSLDADTDGRYIIAPLDFTRRLFDYGGRVSGLAVRFTGDVSEKQLKRRIADVAGEDFTVSTRYEQKASLYRIMRYEKWGVFFIGLMVLVIASFSIVGSLVMLVIDKRENIRTLGALGAPLALVRQTFTRQGMMIGLTGSAAGLILGVAVCAAQQLFGVVPMPAATFLVDSYPVEMKPLDIAAICVSFVAVTYIITTFTVRRAVTRREVGL